MQPADLQIPILIIGSLMVLPAIPSEHSLKQWLPNINWDNFHFELRMWWQLAGIMALATVLRDVSFGVSLVDGLTRWVGSVLVGYVAFTAFKQFVSSCDFPLSERYAILLGYFAIPVLQMRQISLLMVLPILAVLMLWQLRGRWRQWGLLLWGWLSTVGVINWLYAQLSSPVNSFSAIVQHPFAIFSSANLMLLSLIGLVLYFGVLRELNRILR